MADVLLTFCIFTLCYFTLIFQGAETKKVAVKIVEEPAVYKGVNSYLQQHQATATKDLEPRVEPIPFAGPPHLSLLNGQCFSLVENEYKYEFCPFHNVTQKEQTIRWNAFSGILGMFQGWVITNNTFNSMLMDEGDFCPGSNPRQTKVFLKCGEKHGLLSVKEPSTCHYEMDFQTPLACPQDAMLVYPVLSTKGQLIWESIEESLWREEITHQGYGKERKKLFIREGLVAPDVTASLDSVWMKSRDKTTGSANKGESVKGKIKFSTLQMCSKAYEELYVEVERLRKLVIPFDKNKALTTNTTTITATPESPNATNNYETLSYVNRKLNVTHETKEGFNNNTASTSNSPPLETRHKTLDDSS